MMRYARILVLLLATGLAGCATTSTDNDHTSTQINGYISTSVRKQL